MSFLKNRQQRESAFISVHTVLEGVAETEGLSLPLVAGELLHRLIEAGQDAPVFLLQDQHTRACRVAPGKNRDALLRYVATHSNYEGRRDTFPNGPADFTQYGWFRRELASFLGFSDTTCWLDPAWKPQPILSDWQRPYVSRARLSIDEAVCLLLGFDPEEPRPVLYDDDGGFVEYRRWYAALLDAIDHSNINFEESTWSEDRRTQTIASAAIAEWAAATQAPWPFLRETPALSSPDLSALHDELEKARQRIAELEAALLAQATAKSVPDYLNPEHPRYAYKLAAAHWAWHALDDPQHLQGKRALTAAKSLLARNAKPLSLLHSRDNLRANIQKGHPNKKAINEIACIINWEDKGGSPKTPG